MTDDLSTLQEQLGSAIVDEEVIRANVTINVIARSSSAAFKDEEKMKMAWRELEKWEEKLRSIRSDIEDAEDAAAQHRLDACIAPKGGHSHAPQDGSTVANPRRHLTELRFQLNDAERRVQRAEAALRQVQKEVDQRQAQRLAEAQRQEMALAPPAAPSATRQAQSTVSLAAMSPLPPPPPSPSPQKRTPLPAPAVKRVLYRAPAHLRGVTQLSYSGGAVLPSLNRVHLSQADIKAKRRRYQDDSDIEAYTLRVAKRHKLDMIAQQQRRQAEVGDPAALGWEGDAEVVPCASATLQAPLIPVTGKRNDEVLANAPIKTDLAASTAVKVEGGASGNPRLPSASLPSVEVIDVDALMEEEDDVNGAVAIDNLLASVSEDGVAASALSSDLHSTTAGSDGETFIMEEVTLMPGVRVDSSIYDRLLDYQKEGLQWLLTLHGRRAGGILGDEMGLGKTIQVAAFLNTLHHSCQLRGPVLVVAPMTVLRQWLAELHRWAPYMRSCILHDSSGSDTSREALLQSVQGTPAVVITTYSAMRLHNALLQRTGFQYIILDEGHKISNPETGVTLAAKAFSTPHRLILSGSPIQNSLKELWCLFDFVVPGLLGTMDRFIEEFEVPITQSRNISATPLSLATAVECAKALQQHIAPYLLRRLKKQVNTSLPPKYERVLRVPLTDMQLQQYLEVLSSPTVQRLFAQTELYGSRTGGLDRDMRDSSGCLHVAGTRWNMAARRYNSGLRLESFRLMNQLRQICNHADIYAMQRGADEEDRMQRHRGSEAPIAVSVSSSASRHHSRSFRSNNPVNCDGSGKLSALLLMLREWHAFHHRVLIFSQTRMMLDIIENLCEQQGYGYIRMDGTTNSHHRQELMDRFNEDDRIFVALLTTRVGGIGVNLIGADRVVIFDPDWNPTTDLQARERAWRIGQTREVCVYRLITSGTVEEAILRRQLAKVYVTEKVLKNPELQRFFHVQGSFMESFLLGSDYDARLPPDKKYLMAAQAIHPSPSTASSGDSPSVIRRIAAIDELTADNDNDVEHAGADVKDEAVEEKKEEEFGMLVPVKEEEDDNEDVETHSNGQGGRGETHLLQKLVDRQDAAVSGSDRAAQLLARKRAADLLSRVTQSYRSSSGGVEDPAAPSSLMLGVQRQQNSLSLVYALEQKKAKETQDREDQQRYHREAAAAAAAAARQQRR